MLTPSLRAGLTIAVIVGGLILPSTARAQLRGSVQTVTIQGPITGRPVVFSLYLPEGFSPTMPDMPVIYHLHGIGGVHNGQQIVSVPSSYERARAAGTLGPAMIVFPDGYSDSFWADSFSPTPPKPAETNILQEIIPYIEANYPAITTRGGRVIQGFSMGGFGAMKFATKRPDLFTCVVAYDAAMVTWATMQTMHAQQAAQIFGGSESYYNQYSAWFWAGQNAGSITTDVGVRMVVGSLIGGNRNFHAHLMGLSIPVSYVETGLPHTLGPLLDAQGQQSWAFIAAHLDQVACRANFDGVNGVTVQDVFAFLNAWFAIDPAADFDRLNGLTIQDIFAFLNAWFAGCP